MSHFSVLVVGSLKQLASFDENLEVDRYLYKTKDELIQSEKKHFEDFKNGRYADYLKDPVAFEAKRGSEETRLIVERYERESSYTDEDFYKQAIEYYDAENIGENGELYSTMNKDAKWDWYEVGGRWDRRLKVKEPETNLFHVIPLMKEGYAEVYSDMQGEFVNCARKGNIDLEGTYEASRERWNKLYDEMIIKFHSGEFNQMDIEAKQTYFDLAYSAKITDDGVLPTREEYVNANLRPFQTFAILMNGVWYEKGDMIWFGITLNENDNWPEIFKQIFDSIPDNEYVTMVDCHI